LNDINPAKCSEFDYINFLIASSRVFSCTEASKCSFFDSNSPAHDSFTRLLERQPPDTDALWEEVKNLVTLEVGLLIIDDTTLDKPYAKHMDLVYRQWSGKHHQIVNGINLETVVWTNNEAIIPVDFRIYDIDADGKTKNDHFLDMLNVAEKRGFKPKFVLFDTWYASLNNLKAIRKKGWHWLTRLKKNRLVNPDNTGNIAIELVTIPQEGMNVHLKGYGFIKVFRFVSKDGDTQYWATDALNMQEEERKELAKKAWKIEEYHRGIKQFCGIERCQARRNNIQRAHILMAIRAFLRFEVRRIRIGVSWFETKMNIIRNAVNQYIRKPIYLLT
jgi:FOG: Transposase and inactivated derivatives